MNGSNRGWVASSPCAAHDSQQSLPLSPHTHTNFIYFLSSNSASKAFQRNVASVLSPSNVPRIYCKFCRTVLSHTHVSSGCYFSFLKMSILLLLCPVLEELDFNTHFWKLNKDVLPPHHCLEMHLYIALNKVPQDQSSIIVGIEKGAFRGSSTSSVRSKRSTMFSCVSDSFTDVTSV